MKNLLERPGSREGVRERPPVRSGHQVRRATAGTHRPLALTRQRDPSSGLKREHSTWGRPPVPSPPVAAGLWTAGVQGSRVHLLRWAGSLRQAADLPHLQKGLLWGVANKREALTTGSLRPTARATRVLTALLPDGAEPDVHTAGQTPPNLPPLPPATPSHLFPAESCPLTHIQAYLPVYPPDNISDPTPKAQSMSPSPPGGHLPTCPDHTPADHGAPGYSKRPLDRQPALQTRQARICRERAPGRSCAQAGGGPGGKRVGPGVLRLCVCSPEPSPEKALPPGRCGSVG